MKPPFLAKHSVPALLISALLVLPIWANAAAVTSTDLQNVAQLRTLAQRAAKLSLQIQLGVRKTDSSQRLRDNIKQFDQTMSTFSRLNNDEDLQRALDAIQINWDELKSQLVLKDPDQIHLISEQLSLTILRARKTLEGAAGTETSKMVVLAEQQNTLSQRMAKLYYLSCLGRGTQAEVGVTRQRFRTGLDTLNLSKEIGSMSKSKLELAEMQWFFYAQALKDPQQLKKDPNRLEFLDNIATTSDRISEMMSGVISDLNKRKGKTT